MRKSINSWNLSKKQILTSLTYQVLTKEDELYAEIKIDGSKVQSVESGVKLEESKAGGQTYPGNSEKSLR